STFYRYRKDFDHVVEIDTEQIVKRGFVAAALLRGIHVIPDNAPDDRNQLQYGGGFDYYWGDYDFLSFRAISDPRQGGRWSFIASTRWYRGEPIYVQPGLVKHTDGSTAGSCRGRSSCSAGAPASTTSSTGPRSTGRSTAPASSGPTEPESSPPR